MLGMIRPRAMRIEPSACIVCELCYPLAPALRWPGAVVAIDDATLDAMAVCPSGALRWIEPREEPRMQVIDVRTIAPRERHPLIFRAFDELAPGAAFELVNDHDPRPLYHQLRAERGDVLDWSYLVTGPDEWRVRIGRTTTADTVPARAAPTFLFHHDVATLVGEIPPDAIVSRQVYADDLVKVTLFGFAAGQELSEHTASKPAILQVVAGEGTFGLGDQRVEVGPGSFAHMAPHLPHTVTARTPLVMLLTMVKTA